MKIEINSTTDTDSITYALQTGLTTKQLVKFVIDLGNNLTASEEYYQLLKRELSKIKID